MSRSRKPVNPQAEKALDRLKVEVANELGLKDYENRYKGALTSADNGRVGGHMVRRMIEAQERNFAGGQQQTGGTLTAQFDANKQS